MATFQRPGLSEDEISELQEAFSLFDVDGTGIFARFCPFLKPRNNSSPPPSRRARQNQFRGAKSCHAVSGLQGEEQTSVRMLLGRWQPRRQTPLVAYLLSHHTQIVAHRHDMIDSMQQGEISFETFLDIMTARVVRVAHFLCVSAHIQGLPIRCYEHPLQRSCSSKADLLEVFRLFDEHDKGFITLETLTKVSNELGEHISKVSIEVSPHSSL